MRIIAGYRGGNHKLSAPNFKWLPKISKCQSAFGLSFLHESRRSARTTPDGEMILLEDQDRSLWNRELIAEDISLVRHAFASRRLGPYTVQAAISALHAEAPSSAATDWSEIVALYDLLLRIDPSPVV